MELETIEQGLQYVLPYLGTRELLAMEQVCCALRESIQDNPCLWRRLVVLPPLSARLTDGELQKLLARGKGLIEEVVLDGCPRVTTEGLLQGLRACPNLRKLYLPQCRLIRAPEIVEYANSLPGGKPPRLRLLGTSNVAGIPLEELHRLMGALERVAAGRDERERDETRTDRVGRSGVPKLPGWVSQSEKTAPSGSRYKRTNVYAHVFRSDVAIDHWLEDDGRLLDVDMCPWCDQVTQVFQCPEEDRLTAGDLAEPEIICDHSCRAGPCYACARCIPRCALCGICTRGSFGEDQAICRCHVCASCRVGLPECVRCEGQSCPAHVQREALMRSSPRYFLCYLCGTEGGEEEEGWELGASWGCPA